MEEEGLCQYPIQLYASPSYWGLISVSDWCVPNLLLIMNAWLTHDFNEVINVSFYNRRARERLHLCIQVTLVFNQTSKEVALLLYVSFCEITVHLKGVQILLAKIWQLRWEEILHTFNLFPHLKLYRVLFVALLHKCQRLFYLCLEWWQKGRQKNFLFCVVSPCTLIKQQIFICVVMRMKLWECACAVLIYVNILSTDSNMLK